MQSTLRYPLNEILGSRASLLVMRALFAHRGEMTAASLVLHTGLSKRGVHHALATLTAMRIVEELGAGRSRLYRASAAYPLYAPLSALFEAEEGRYQAIIDEIGKIADADDAILAVWLYGSVARREDGVESDLDLTLAVRNRRAARSEADFRDKLGPIERRLSFDANVVALEVDDVARLDFERDPWWASLGKDAIVVRGDRPERFLPNIKKPRKTK